MFLQDDTQSPPRRKNDLSRMAIHHDTLYLFINLFVIRITQSDYTKHVQDFMRKFKGPVFFKIHVTNHFLQYYMSISCQ